MQSLWIRTFALAVVLVGTGLLCGQQGQNDPTKNPPVSRIEKGDPLPPDTSTGTTGQPVKAPADKPAPPKTKLEEMLQQALQNNPDIRVAEAKMAEAEAQLNRTRLVVMQKVVLYNAKLEDAKLKVEFAEKALNRVKKLAGTGAVTAEELDAAQAGLQSAKAEQAKVEAELPLLLGAASDKTQQQKALEWLRRYSLDVYGDPGKWRHFTGEEQATAELFLGKRFSGSSNTDQGIEAIWQSFAVKPSVQGPMAERIQKALDRSTKVQLSGKPKEVLADLLGLVDGVSFNIRLTNEEISDKLEINLDFAHEMPLGAAFQALQDVCLPSVRFVVRDYGILVTDEKHVPPGAPLLYDVWKGANQKAKPEKAELFPAGRIEGQIDGKIKAVDGKAMLVTITIGSNAGLQKDDKLTIIRAGSPSKISSGIYAGTVKIVEATADEAVCHIESTVMSPDQLPKVGDIATYLPPAK